MCGSEKRYDEYHSLYKPCDSCNAKSALNYYFINKDKLLEKKMFYYHNKKEFFSEQNKKRKSKTADLEKQVNALTVMIKYTISVASLYEHFHTTNIVLTII